jgi:hypothetical protein
MTDFVIALDSDPYDDNSTTTDVATVTADNYDSPITAIAGIDGNDSDPNLLLIESYIQESPGYTPRQVVGLFGVTGMYREA